MKSDIQIAQKAKLQPILKVAAKIGIKLKDLEFYGGYKAKVSLDLLKKSQKPGKLILVTAMTPTPAGEGKTTTTVGLGQALWQLGKKSMICLREPSLGPCFGIKGGAAGGGYSQVLPMEEINLHFTGDIHAVGAANNLLAAMIDNHIYHGNELGIDPQKITWRRCLDISDRSLRENWDITVASEVMAILCLTQSLQDLKKRLAKIVVAANKKGQPVTARELKAAGAMTVLLKDALRPNLVQTIEGSPAFIHGGPFANIAHGCNSLLATKTALKLVDYVVTEAGFGADLGAEKFFDIKCRLGGLKPQAVVLVATVRALKHHGQGQLEKGLANLAKHIENIKLFGVPLVVAINQFDQDTAQEISLVKNYCQQRKVKAILSSVWENGGKGGIDLAKEVLRLTRQKNHFKPLYPLQWSLSKKVETIVKKIYGGKGVIWSAQAEKDLAKYQKWGIKDLPVCMAKTQASLSDDAQLLGAPTGFKVRVREIRLSRGAGFFIVIAGQIMTMPGLPKIPAANDIDIDKGGKTIGLF
jgi:formate--tetrahydrofolate ligase